MRRTANVLVISFAAVAIIAAGCAKRPAMSQAQVPAPPGPVETKRSNEPTTPSQPSQTRQPARAAQRNATVPADRGTARPAPSEFMDVAALKEIHFDFDKYDVRKGDAEILDGNADWLKSHADHLVLIEGHCDERGTNEYNTVLGERRAKSTMDYLVSRGVQSTRISIVSYGEERPVCSEHNEGCWSNNRRAHFLAKPR